MYEVPREPSHTPSRTFYLWHVDEKLLMSRYKGDLLDTALKMHERYMAEAKVLEPVYDTIDAKVSGKSGREKSEIIRNFESLIVEALDVEEIQELQEELQPKFAHMDFSFSHLEHELAILSYK